MKKRVAVILSGCGHKDGTEITEAVSLIIELSRNQVEVVFFAPAIEFEVYDPITNKSTHERRNLLLESARITRGKIAPLNELEPTEYSGLALPGGFGVARNLSSWATRGAACELLPELSRILLEFHRQQKPIAAICIAPILLAKTLGSSGAVVTIGDDKETSMEITKTGAKNEPHSVSEFCIDKKNKLFTTPAYMFGKALPHEIWQGIAAMTSEFVKAL